MTSISPAIGATEAAADGAAEADGTAEADEPVVAVGDTTGLVEGFGAPVAGDAEPNPPDPGRRCARIPAQAAGSPGRGHGPREAARAGRA